MMLMRHLQDVGEVSERLLRALPQAMVAARRRVGQPASSRCSPRSARGRPRPGGGARPPARRVLIAALRAWLARPDAEAPGWYRAHGRPGRRPRAAAAPEDPARAVDAADLADECGISRAALARRFTELVGEPPMSLPDRPAPRARRRPAARAGRDDRRGRRAGRLRQRVRAEHRVQARARREPGRAPRRVREDVLDALPHVS